jgi:DNA mismatch repair protein MutL
MPKIHLLDDRLISQIAAGEVVERPASVVKELVENALDAGARSVEVELEAGGKRRIVVADDGSGMGGDDALLAFDRHATSKIRSYQDLEKVATLGFRGEALASIAAVSRVELQTAEDPGEGQRVRVEAGRILGIEPVSLPRGTRIEVASLFFSVPARRKFLKSPETELRRCLEVVQGYTLAHPECRFALRHEGKLLLEADRAEGEDGARERIAQIFGRDFAKRLHEIPLEFVGEREAIWGYVGDRETSRGRRNFLFVNRRLVRDRILSARFYQAVRQEWHSDEFPSLFLFLELEPEMLDVNVHPQKHEVRFRSDAFVDRVEAALRQTLALARGEEPAYLRTPRSLPQMPATWEGLGGRFDRSYAPPPGPLFGGGGQAGEVGERRTPYDPAWREAAEERPSLGDASRPTEPVPPPQPAPSIARPSFPPLVPSNVPLSGRGRGPTAFRLLGQYKGSLVLLEGYDGLYLVDQHAAHERILYERLRRSFAAQAPQSQVLLTPLMLELSPAEALRLAELSPALLACGFEVMPLSGGTVALRAAPDSLGLDQAELLVRRLATANGAADGEEDGAGGVARLILEELAADRSCKAAIKIHRLMGAAEMEALVSELFACDQPYACPHGRPTVLYLGDAELERRFGRRG